MDRCLPPEIESRKVRRGSPAKEEQQKSQRGGGEDLVRGTLATILGAARPLCPKLRHEALVALRDQGALEGGLQWSWWYLSAWRRIDFPPLARVHRRVAHRLFRRH